MYLPRPLKRFLKQRLRAAERSWRVWRADRAAPGTRAWLVGKEIQFGGIVRDVPRNKVSPHDRRTPERLRQGGMIGGDRMLHHGYAPKYAEYLRPFVSRPETVTVLEVGILQGTGLALWCDLFPKGRVIGLDIDLGHIQDNWERLKSRGAFEQNEPELYEFDQLGDNTELLASILSGQRVDIGIDDGLHSIRSIVPTFESIAPYLGERFAYFVEDNPTAHETLTERYPDLDVDSAGELTVISQGVRTQ